MVALVGLGCLAGAAGCARAGHAPFTAGGGCEATPYHRLDFWLGEWEVRNPSGGLEGVNVVSRVQRGCAIEERWSDADGTTGESLFHYDRADGAWKQTWVTDDGQWKDKREEPGAVAAAGAIRFGGTLPAPGGGVILDRTTLTPLAGGVDQVIEQSRDGGKTWIRWEGLHRPHVTAACDGAHERELDFWVGDWDAVIRTRRAAGSDEWDVSRGRNTITKAFGGCVIEEHFQDIDPKSPWRGTSVSRWIPAETRWRQTWVDDQGSYLAFTGGRDPWGFVLVGEPAMKDGVRSQMRMVFRDVTGKSFTWRWERTVNDGQTWTPMMKIAYTRR